MRKLILPILLGVFLGSGVLSLMQVVRGQSQNKAEPLNQEIQGENRRAIEGSPSAAGPQGPDIGFIDSPSATCYQPDPGSSDCYLNWYYLSVSADPNYVISMTLQLNESGPIAHTQGFFQKSMFVPSTMFGQGFKVACGSPGAGGDPLLGNSYAYTIRARDTAGLKAANYGTIYCPAAAP